MINIVYFSNYSKNTKRFVDNLGLSSTEIPIVWNAESELIVKSEYVLFVPTYGGGSPSSAIPKSVKKFLNVRSNRELLRGVVGFGNTNFGEDFCKAAVMISKKTKVPLIAKVEIFGTQDDLERVKDRLEMLYGQ